MITCNHDKDGLMEGRAGKKVTVKSCRVASFEVRRDYGSGRGHVSLCASVSAAGVSYTLKQYADSKSGIHLSALLAHANIASDNMAESVAESACETQFHAMSSAK